MANDSINSIPRDTTTTAPEAANAKGADGVNFAAVMGMPAAMRPDAASSNMTVADASPQAPADPRVAMHDRMSQLYGVIAQEEADKNQKGSWTQGQNLRQLGSLYIESGDVGLGRLYLKDANQVLRDAPKKPADAEMTITEALVDYGQALLKPVPHEPMAAKQKDFKDADQIFGAVVDRARLEHRSPEDLAVMLKLKADADISLADTYNPKDASGKTAYLADMQSAMTALNGGIDLLGSAKTNDSKLTDARLHSELGFAETQVNSVDRNNWYNSVWGAGLVGYGRFDATAEYKKSIDLFHQYNAGSDPQQQAVKDEELLTTLSRYDKSVRSDGSAGGSASAQQEQQAILQNHPNWQMKM